MQARKQTDAADQSGYAASDSTPSTDAHLQKQVQADHCQGKSLCCVAALMPAASLNTPGLTVTRIAAAAPLPAYHSAESALPERPPRF
ncbi:hypothetical protein H8K47_10400 [Undibacterium sp. CY7W]|uniref:Uncharacterized protein n=1 Tax=Undibacterium rugosum TaxID=2762291 RepID=A0A923I3P1_9BURK|nr:hypothetical protein [Undibacterium rugosum]MBC3935770.1 hypothetical protein [Undibacterium rugosum]